MNTESRYVVSLLQTCHNARDVVLGTCCLEIVPVHQQVVTKMPWKVDDLLYLPNLPETSGQGTALGGYQLMMMAQCYISVLTCSILHCLSTSRSWIVSKLTNFATRCGRTFGLTTSQTSRQSESMPIQEMSISIPGES